MNHLCLLLSTVKEWYRWCSGSIWLTTSTVLTQSDPVNFKKAVPPNPPHLSSQTDSVSRQGPCVLYFLLTVCVFLFFEAQGGAIQEMMPFRSKCCWIRVFLATKTTWSSKLSTNMHNQFYLYHVIYIDNVLPAVVFSSIKSSQWKWWPLCILRLPCIFASCLWLCFAQSL